MTRLAVFVFVAVVAADTPATANSGASLTDWAALVASLTGLVTAIGAIAIGLRKRSADNTPARSEAADKAIEYLIKQNRDLLKERSRERGES